MKKTRGELLSEEAFASRLIPVIWQTHPDTGELADASMLFLQGCSLSELPAIAAWIQSGPLANATLMLHIDLLAGLASDEAGLRYIAGLDMVDGIITVRPHLVGAARRLGLASILLLFLQDGRAVERGLHVIEQSRPDAVELVPGVAALETAGQFAQVGVPRIAGGLVRTPELVQDLLAGGFRAVSTSNQGLWSLNRSIDAR